MKRSELIFNLLSIPIDAGMLMLAGISAFHLRLNYEQLIGPVRYDLQIQEFLSLAIQVVPVIILIFLLFGLYKQDGPRRMGREAGKIISALSVSLAIVVIMFFFDQTIFPSRFIILATGLLAFFYVCIGRLALLSFQKLFFRKGYGLHRVVLISHKNSSIIEDSIYRNKNYGYQVIKEIKSSDAMFEELEMLAKKHLLDEIVQTDTGLMPEDSAKLLVFARSEGLQFSFVPNTFDIQKNAIEVSNFIGLPVISIKNTPLDGWGKVAKRLIDYLGSIVALLILSPIFLLIYICIKLDSPGPVIYKALRGGKDRDFWFYKFRSMYAHLSPGLGGKEAEDLRKKLWQKNDRGGENGPFLKIKNDPRVTPVGKLLRKTKLDEIPQFWNVLKGDMSLVGPRAHVLDEVERYRDANRRMFSIKPGIFGISQLAQVSNPDLPFEEEVKLNTYYIENWSLFLDLKILLESAYILVFGNKSNEDY